MSPRLPIAALLWLPALCTGKRQNLAVDPYGLAHTQNPGKELVSLMFDMFALLEAGVYRGKLKRYASPENREECTRSYRAQHQFIRAQDGNFAPTETLFHGIMMAKRITSLKHSSSYATD